MARLDLDVARDQLSILLAQLDEGRATAEQVDEARFVEQEKWIALYQADTQWSGRGWSVAADGQSVGGAAALNVRAQLTLDPSDDAAR